MDDEMAKEIENSVLERCSPHGDVVHVYIDRRSPFVSCFTNLSHLIVIATCISLATIASCLSMREKGPLHQLRLRNLPPALL